jgi:hypothetical protein
MAGGNFDDNLTIGTDGRIDPAGPLGDFGQLPGTTKIHFHFWVVQLQGGTIGAFMQAQGMRQPAPDLTRWTTSQNHIHHHGAFLQGQAFATAVAILDSGEMDWWSRTIRLLAPGGTAAATVVPQSAHTPHSS